MRRSGKTGQLAPLFFPSFSSMFPVQQAEWRPTHARDHRIIRADTGTGKTLIAILLLKQITSISGKFCVFLSPNVALVYRKPQIRF